MAAKYPRSVKFSHLSHPSTSKVEPGKDAGGNAEESNIAGDLFWPIILFLKLAGNCPLSYIPKNEERALDEDSMRKFNHLREYKIRLFSPFTILSLAHGGIALVMWVIQEYEIFTGREIFNSPFFNSKMFFQHYVGTNLADPMSMDGMIRMIFGCVPLIQILEIILSWWESRDFGIFLNNLFQIQRDYFQAFPLAKEQEHSRSNLNRVRLLFIIFYVLTPTIIGFIMIVYFNALEDLSILGFVASTLMLFQITFVSLLEDVKVIMCYFMMAQLFSQIKSNMVESLKVEIITTEKVKSWRKLIHQVRLEAQFTGTWQKCHQLMLLMGFIILITGAAFLILVDSPKAPNYAFILFIKVAYILMMAGRVYLKIYAANLIYHEESLIARELIFADFPTNEFSMQLEVQFLHDMMKQTPCVISFGNYVTVNKKLILGIASQVVTYLIVLLQFYQ